LEQSPFKGIQTSVAVDVGGVDVEMVVPGDETAVVGVMEI
jgi:hypothetical protein